MEYLELVRATLDDREREAIRLRLGREARRLGIAQPRSPLARVDDLLIRAGRGAVERRARREVGAENRRGLAS